MRNCLTGLVLIAIAAGPASAALPTGAKAPDFTTTGALGGKPFKLNLAAQLKKGPVVLYFYPKAFTQGCTLEAHAFSEAEKDFKKAGAQVIGMSADDLPTLKKFSVEGCRSAFPVATATPAVIKAYDVSLKQKPELTDRTSYVIGRDGKIVFVHSDLNWSEHVTKTLAAVKALKR
ncbi:peroxiredoxin [Sphingomonas daechungensis]|uniref:thioredoxin-dependent peroxiredoxin n=1 Tax=Sphingomonas daechungensis TaxID=1176646 RepID=A0ABX6T2P2_9SPHN|nr:peroxiredoxin [Sphingomonas daechungensis]QNP44152.1 peroxiredoxin [Sphingomonas daechungensis]